MIDEKFNTNIRCEEESEGESGVAVVTEQKTKAPKRYKVIMHNDDYTTMEFVLHVLKSVFRKSQEAAQAIMLKIHHEGRGVCGIYTFEIAETKVQKVLKMARENEYPLRCSVERED